MHSLKQRLALWLARNTFGTNGVSPSRDLVVWLNLCTGQHGFPRVAFHDHPLFINEDRLSASLRALYGRYRAKVEADGELYLRRRLSASLSTLLKLR